MKGETRADGIEVELSADQTRTIQKWEVLYQLNLQTLDTTDIMVIFNKHSHKCLDVQASTRDRASVARSAVRLA
jgi:hypothetical protein